jgi:hypothetical protein
VSNDDFWVKASTWAAQNFTCDYLPKDACGKPVKRIHVREGEPQAGYCYPHYLEAKTAAADRLSDVSRKETR